MSDEKTYIEYPGGEKVNIMDVDGPLILDRTVQINEISDINIIKVKIKNDVDKLAKLCIEKRGPIKDGFTVVSCKPNAFEKVQSPIWENVENAKTGEKYIRYGRTIEFI